MKCDDCENECVYSTGSDEYPPLTTMTACKKDHWFDDPGPQCEEQSGMDDPWINCIDYKQITPTQEQQDELDLIFDNFSD